MKTKLLCEELLKTRNELVKTYLRLQAISIHDLKSCDAIMDRMDNLFDYQEAIKQLDIIINFALQENLTWEMISLMTESENIETWKPQYLKLKDYKSINKPL